MNPSEEVLKARQDLRRVEIRLNWALNQMVGKQVVWRYQDGLETSRVVAFSLQDGLLTVLKDNGFHKTIHPDEVDWEATIQLEAA